jgi:tetratricopeptide (TPR) repeat protein
LFNKIFKADPEKYKEAVKTLLMNCLTEKPLSSPPVYSMLSPFKDVVFEFGRSIKQECIKLLRKAFEDVYGATFDKNNMPDYSGSGHDLALSCLEQALSFLKKTKGDVKENQVLFESMKNYFQYSPSESLEALKSLEPMITRLNGELLFKAIFFTKVGDLEWINGDTDSAKEHYRKAKKYYYQRKFKIIPGLEHSLADLLITMGDLESTCRNFNRAKEYHDEAEAIYSDQFDKNPNPEKKSLTLAKVSLSRGKMESRQGERAKAILHFEKAKDFFSEMEGKLGLIGLAHVHHSWGNCERKHGFRDSAKNYYAKAEGAFRDMKHKHGLANVLRSMGHLEKFCDKEFAREYYNEALELFNELRHTHSYKNVLESINDL